MRHPHGSPLQFRRQARRISTPESIAETFGSSGGYSASRMNRRHFLRQASASFVIALSPGCASQAPDVGDRRMQIARLMARLHERHEFTGEILGAQKGNVIYEGAFGVADLSTGQPYTTKTRSCLASLSKPFTATAIMMLAEQSRLAYDDPLSRFVSAISYAVF